MESKSWETTPEGDGTTLLHHGNGGRSQWGDVFQGENDGDTPYGDYRLLLTSATYETHGQGPLEFVDLNKEPGTVPFELFTDSAPTTAPGSVQGASVVPNSAVSAAAYSLAATDGSATPPGAEYTFLPAPADFPLFGPPFREMSAPEAPAASVPADTQQAKLWAKVDKLKDVFFKGLEEYRNAAEPLEALIPGLGDSNSADGALKLSAAVIQAMDIYCYQCGMDAKLERQKFHELFQNLKRENNKELRFKIFKGEITIGQLVAMDAKELAPEALKRKRESESEKYFQQQVILKQDPAAAVIRKTHKGLETVGDEDVPMKAQDAKKDSGSSSPSPCPSSKQSEDVSPKFLNTGSVPWQDEMANLLEVQNESTPNELSEAETSSAEPPGKKPRIGDYVTSMTTQKSPNISPSPSMFPDKSPSATSPAAFTQLVFRPWESLAWNHRELFEKLRMTEAPSDPADGSLHSEVTRLEDRLTWLRQQSERRYERYLRHEDTSQMRPRDLNKPLIQIRNLSASLECHSRKISESMSIPLDVPNLMLPAGVMMSRAYPK